MIPEEGMPDDHEADTFPGIRAVVVTKPMSEMEYWDPIDNVYKNKRSNKCVQKDLTLEMSESEEYNSDSSRYSETTSDEAFSKAFGYWNPGFDVYRRKKWIRLSLRRRCLRQLTPTGIRLIRLK